MLFSNMYVVGSVSSHLMVCLLRASDTALYSACFRGILFVRNIL
jgi:hypothetical protein